MKTIWKYRLKGVERQEILMHAGAEILTVQMQGPYICIWAKIDTQMPTAKRVICIYGTGEGITDHLKYIGTVQQDDFVWHVFSEI